MTHQSFGRKPLALLAVVAVIIVAGTSPLSAQTASDLDCSGCVNRKDIAARAVSSTKIAPSITLGTPSKPGQLRLNNDENEAGARIVGATGNFFNAYSNDPQMSNGLVKGWAMINADGSIEACWRCNTDPTATGLLDTGRYEVDFTPVSTDITGRPRAALIDDHSIGTEGPGEIGVADRSGNPSAIFVETTNSEGIDTSLSFTIILF